MTSTGMSLEAMQGQAPVVSYGALSLQSYIHALFCQSVAFGTFFSAACCALPRSCPGHAPVLVFPASVTLSVFASLL